MELTKIQSELKVPKGNVNSFGKYKYRSAEDILEAVKPLLLKYNGVLTLSDSIIEVSGRLFMKSEATLISDVVYTVCGFAELSEHKGMSSEQACGTASSYARKYALNGLFLIDETASDPDSKPPHTETRQTIDDTRFEAAIKAIQAGKTTKEVVIEKFKLSQEQLLKLDSI